MKKVFILLGIFIAIFSLFYSFGGHKYLDFNYLKEQQNLFQNYKNQNFLLTTIIFMFVYIISNVFSLPGAALLTVLAGAIFGLLWGTIIVSFSSTIGATLSMIVARFFIREAIEKKFPDFIKKVNDGIEKEGWMYLLTMRLVPAIPFFIVNLVMGVTKIKVLTFAIISQIGMLAGTIIYVNAGTQLAKIDSLKGILSPQIIASFVLLAVFPFIVKFIINKLKSREKS